MRPNGDLAPSFTGNETVDRKRLEDVPSRGEADEKPIRIRPDDEELSAGGV